MDSAVCRAHEGLILIARDFVSTHRKRLANDKGPLRHLIGIAKRIGSRGAQNRSTRRYYHHLWTVCTIAYAIPRTDGSARWHDGDQPQNTKQPIPSHWRDYLARRPHVAY